MFQRLSSSWELVKASWGVLRADKELIVFPIASTIATLMVIVVFTIPLLIAGAFDNMADNGSPGIAGYVVAFLFYLVMYFVMIFSNTALVGAALIRLRGGDPTLNDGLKIAMDRLGQILGYAIISATVGMILRAIQERGGIVGQIAAWIGGVAWSIATYLVVPVLVVENVDPIEAVKRSASLLKQTWGEQIVGNFSIGLVFGLLSVAALLVIGVPLFVIAIASDSVVLIILAVILTVLVIAAINLVGSTLQGIYVAAVYRYATESVVSDDYFPPGLIEGAFRRK